MARHPLSDMLGCRHAARAGAEKPHSARDPFRAYGPDELDVDGYPPEWRRGIVLLADDEPYALDRDLARRRDQFSIGIKDVVRQRADHRCIRCGHPYRTGESGSGHWSPCDRHCSHRGPARLSYRADDGSPVVELEHRLATEAGVVVGYGKRVEAEWRILTVHHLDGHKANCRWWNLVALCQRCHLEIQGRVVMDRVWPHEHSDWFKPYVAGYYAWRYLGQEISRQEAEQREDELLGLEVRQLALEAT